MKFYIVGNYREEFDSIIKNNDKIYNDHCSKQAIDFMIDEIKKIDYDIEYFGGIEELIKAIEYKIKFNENTIFINISNGLQEKNRKAQAPILLEMLAVKFSGSSANTILMVGDKFFTNQILKNYDIKNLHIPEGFLYRKYNPVINKQLSYPVIVKPNSEGSSIGISQKSICHNDQELEHILNKLSKNFNEILVENYIPGYEVTNFVIGNNKDILFNECLINFYESKNYFENFVFGANEKASGKRTQKLAIDYLDLDIINNIKSFSEEIFNYLGMKDIARFDYRVWNDKIYFIEVNANPVISKTSELGIICKLLNKPYSYIFKKYITTIINRFNHD